jgi:drug/metabolite transporter (DMT)-like permease
MKKGIQLSFLTAIISGLSVFANSVFVAKSDPLVFAVCRNMIMVVIFSGLLLLTGNLNRFKLLTRKDWFKLLAIGAIGGGIPFALFFTGLKGVGAVNANLINKSLFLWVAILAIPFLREKLHWLSVIGYGILFYATFIFGGSFTVVPKTGIFLVLAATLFWSVEYVIAKKTLQHIPVTLVSWGRMVFGLPFLMGAVMMVHKSDVIATTFMISTIPLVVSSILLTAYILSWYYALAKAPATIVTSILALAPAITLIITSLAKPAFVTIPQYSNMVLVLIGILLITWVHVRKTPV